MLDIPAEDLTRVARMELAESALHAPAATFGGVEFSPDLARKTAVLAARLINNHPLPGGNRRVGDLYALEFVARNGGTWTYAPDDPDGDGTVAIIEGVASGEIDEGTLTSWIADRLAGSDDTPDYPTGSQRPLSPRHHRAVPRRLLPNEITRGGRPHVPWLPRRTAHPQLGAAPRVSRRAWPHRTDPPTDLPDGARPPRAVHGCHLELRPGRPLPVRQPLRRRLLTVQRRRPQAVPFVAVIRHTGRPQGSPDGP